MSINADFLTVLSGLTSVPVEQNKVSQDKASTRIWFGYAGSEPQLFLDGSPSLTDVTFDVECQSLSVDEAEALGEQVLTLNGYHGAFGSSQVLGVFVSEQSDDYQPRGIDTDVSINVASFRFRILQGGSGI